MRVYRICKTAYAEDLNGTGAALFGGRWNPKGFPMLYTAGSTSLAILEFMAHNFHLMPELDLTLTVLEVKLRKNIEEINIDALPPNWNKALSNQRFTQGLGAEFLNAKRAYALRVPSVLAPHEFNILLNPKHPAHQEINIIEKYDAFKLDDRLFGLH